jgi:hypothetical protein
MKYLLLAVLVVGIIAAPINVARAFRAIRTRKNAPVKGPELAHATRQHDLGEEPSTVQRDGSAAVSPAPAFIPATLIVRDIEGGKSTLLIHHNTSRKRVSGHLIIWAGKRRRKLGDSYYDLGRIDSGEFTDEAIDQFMQRAALQLGELVQRGKRKRVTADDTTVLPGIDTNSAEPVAPVTTLENDPAQDPSIKLRRHPAVYRGVIVKAGMMERALQDGVSMHYGVCYRAPEGVEDTVWGVDLKQALSKGGACVGDAVEILKLGRKFIEEGKAPMNLFKVTKIDPALLRAAT